MGVIASLCMRQDEIDEADIDEFLSLYYGKFLDENNFTRNIKEDASEKIR